MAVAWGAVFLASVACLWLLRGAPAATTALFVEGVSPHPYVVAEHAGLLYILTPAAVLLAVLVFFAPGLHVVLAYGTDERGAPVVMKAFAAALGLLVLWSSTLKVITNGPVAPTLFLSGWALLALGTWALWFRRLQLGARTGWPWHDPVERRRVWWYLAFPVITVVALLPVLFWQDLNADGSEALEIGRSLRWFVVPRFLDGNGFIGLGIGMIPMAFPVHWFDMAFGSIEATARLPLALYLPALYAALVALVELESPRRLRPPEMVTIALGVALFVFVLGFNASYDNYFADLSSPTAFEAFTVFTVLAAAYTLWAGEVGWFLWLALLSFVARPTGVLLVGLLGVSAAWTTPALRKRVVRWLPMALLIWIGVFVVYENVYIPWASGGQAGYGSGSIIGRFQYLRFDHVAKFIYVIVPAGILPVFACLAIRRHDSISRALVVASVGYFLVFYFPAFTNLHHFAPVMVLPIVVYWRTVIRWTTRWWPTAAALVGISIAFGLSRPRHFLVNQTMRRIGWATEYRVGAYDGSADQYRESVAGLPLFSHLVRPEWEVVSPEREHVGGAHQWYYAMRPKPESATENYLILPADGIPPVPYQLVA